MNRIYMIGVTQILFNPVNHVYFIPHIPFIVSK